MADLETIQQKIISFSPLEKIHGGLFVNSRIRNHDSAFFLLRKRFSFSNGLNGTDERDWAQFHDPKNLAEALSIEAETSYFAPFEIAKHTLAEKDRRTGNRWEC